MTHMGHEHCSFGSLIQGFIVYIILAPLLGYSGGLKFEPKDCNVL